MRHNKVVLKWIVRMALLAVLLFVVYMVLEVTVISEYRHEHGFTYRGAMAKFYSAMGAGDPDEAKHWADRMLHYSSTTRPSPSVFGGRLGLAFGYSAFSGREYQRESYRCLANAHELAGEYEQALSLCQQHGDWPRDEGRVRYKLGKRKQAFETFCKFALLEKQQLNLTLPLNMQSARVKTFRERARGGYFSYEKALWPFKSYTGFLNFMRREWKGTDNDEKYREAMEFIEAAGGAPKKDGNLDAGGSQSRKDVIHVEVFAGGYSDEYPLMCRAGGDFPGGREVVYRRRGSGEAVHAVFPNAARAPDHLDGSFVLHGHFQGTQNRDAFVPTDGRPLTKMVPEDYRYFVVSRWERAR